MLIQSLFNESLKVVIWLIFTFLLLQLNSIYIATFIMMLFQLFEVLFWEKNDVILLLCRDHKILNPYGKDLILVNPL